MSMKTKKQPKDIQILKTDVLLSDLVRIHAPTIVKTLECLPSGKPICNCCCCCCNQNTTPAANDTVCNVDEFSVQQELRLDPNSFGVAGGPTIIGTRAMIAWSVSAPVGSTVTVQVRTRGLDGNPGGIFPDWTDTQFTGQSLIDQVQFNFNDFLGTKVEFRVVVLSSDGNILCVGRPDS